MTETIHHVKAAMDAAVQGWFSEWRGRRCWRRVSRFITESSRSCSAAEEEKLRTISDRVSRIDQNRRHSTISGRKARLSPVVKAWLDRVLVPAMVERYIAKFRSGGDNRTLESVQ